MVKGKFGQFLISEDVITPTDFRNAIRRQKISGLKIGEILVEEGHIEEYQLISLLGQHLGVKTATIDEVRIIPEIADKMSKKIALKYKIVPVNLNNGKDVYFSLHEPIPPAILENFRRVHKVNIHQLLMNKEDNSLLLKRAYSEGFDADVQIENMEEVEENPEQAISIVDNILLKAISQRTSDIHIEPERDALRVRFRVDGVLRTVEKLPKDVASSVVSRIKVLSNMNIADKRSSQDGGFKFEKSEEHGVSINLRVSTLPCAKGEKVVLRLLPTEENVLSLEQLGMGDAMIKVFRDILELPHGIIFVTGPTGSGKTNTLYAALKHLRSDEVNITTVEDPVELQMDGINQAQTDNANKFSFSKALRTILRQDPNIIMVGEVRDGETAGLALEAALTGHLVLSTLHTNDATSAFGRLIDMGCEPFLVTSSVRAVLAQRLIRVICSNCKEGYKPSVEELESVGLVDEKDNITLYRGKGCSACNGSGYKGRTGIFELFILDFDIQRLIANGADPGTIRSSAIKGGMKILRDDGIMKLKKGLTTTSEILKATME